MPQSYLPSLIQKSAQDFIFENEDLDENLLVLKQKTTLGIPTPIIADQFAGRRKAKCKLPSFYKTRGIVYPPSLNLEQTSSELTARFKREIIQSRINSKNKHGADLTGGFGVDAYLLSSICDRFDYVEHNPELLKLAKHNHQVLKATNINYHHTTAEDFLKSTSRIFDFIFIDPSRRNKSQKVLKQADGEPNVIELLPVIFSKTDTLLVKASPLLDIQQGLRELTNVSNVFVVAVDNECKELLFLCQKGVVAEPEIHSVNLSSVIGRTREAFSLTLSREVRAVSVFSDPLTYLYEPNASILKSGAFKSIGQQFDLKKIQINTHLYTSHKLVSDFPGRIFKILAVNPKPDQLKTIFDGGQANVMTRNYPLTPDALKKKLKLKAGSENFLIGFSGPKQKYLVAASRVSIIS
jgi:16S rRNA G966 N2-methylase RsmD